jgi:hypothetical protein
MTGDAVFDWQDGGGGLGVFEEEGPISTVKKIRHLAESM